MEKQGEFGFNVFILAILIVAYLEVITLNQTSAVFPRVVILVMGLTWIAIVLPWIVPLSFKILPSQEDTLEEGEDDSAEFAYEINIRKTATTFAWIGSFLIGLFYIGFFSSVFLFSSLHFYANYNIPSKRRSIYSIALGSTLVAIQYIFFIHLLERPFLLRIGFLP